MTDQNLLDRVRSKTITSLERSIRIYTKDGTKRWLNESVTRTLITALRDKTPIKIVAPFWAEHLYDVLTDEGLEQGSQEYRETWHNIEEGK